MENGNRVNGAAPASDIRVRPTANDLEEGSTAYFSHLVAANLSEAVVLTNPEGLIQWVNPMFERLTGYRGADVVGRKPGMLLQGPATDQNTVAEIREAIQARRFISRELVNYSRDGVPYWISLSITPIFDDAGRHIHFAALTYDISRYKAAEEEVARRRTKSQKEERERHMLTVISQWLYAARTIDELCAIIRSGIMRLFPSAEGALYVYRHSRDRLELRTSWGDHKPPQTMHAHECWGMRRGRVHIFGRDPLDIRCAHDLDSKPTSSICVPLLAQGESVGMLQVRFPSDGEGCETLDEDELAELAESLAHRRGMLLLISEQTALTIANIELREELLSQSSADALTGLPNRRKFLDEAREIVHMYQMNGKPLSLLSVDVDNFKSINDRLGHATGDEVLKMLAKVMSDCAGEDMLVARYGGEEFAILPRHSAPHATRAFGEKLVSEVERVSAAMSSFPDVTISVGFASMMVPQGGLSRLMERADDALYRAKRAGRNRLIAHDEPKAAGEDPPQTAMAA
ncbi:MAG: diguanylate cyclase [Pseudomonadota bacterium]